MYSRDDIDLILDRIDPLEVLEYCGVPTTSVTSGEIRCACPIHNGDNSTAFSFDRFEKIFTCFSHNCCSSKRRDVITFLMEVRNYTFKEAIEVLANLAGVQLSEQQKDNISQFEKHYMLSYSRYLYKVDKYKPVKLKQLRMRNKYPKGWDMVEQYLKSPQRNSDIDSVKYFGLYPGLDSDKYLRLYIPLHDEEGRLVGLTGRMMDGVLSYPPIQKEDGTIKHAPKYDNVAGFKKSQILYNLHRAKKHAHAGLIVVEGQFDAIRMHNYGYPNTVARMGPVLSDQQVALLYKYTTSVVLLIEDYKKIDPETNEILSLVNKDKDLEKLKYGMKIHVAYLEKDPDSSTQEEVNLAIQNAELLKRL